MTSKPPVILVRSGWQTANIGDIAHTPGLLSLLETHLPDAKLILWGVNLGDGVEEKLRRQFPKVRFVHGARVEDGTSPETAVLSGEVREAFTEADLFILSSSPAIHRVADFAAWRALTGKPYGYYGVTMDHSSRFAQLTGKLPPSARIRDVLDHAAFIFFRETLSLDEAVRDGIRSPIMEFGPDAVFGVRQYDDEGATGWMQANELEAGKFICVIARTRFAPYYKMHNRPPTENEAMREGYNREHMDADLGKVRDAITRWVRTTRLKVALVPEMTFEVELQKEQILDRLPDDVKPFVVWRDRYWMPDEAASVYAKAIALLSMECHSPIIAATAGTPALYLTSPTETFKKNMWKDIGLGEWMFEVEEIDGEILARALLDIHAAPVAAREKTRTAMARVAKRQQETMAVIRQTAMGGRQRHEPQLVQP